MSLDIGEGTRPLLKGSDDDTDDDENSELDNSSLSQSEGTKLEISKSQTETDKDTETESDNDTESDDDDMTDRKEDETDENRQSETNETEDQTSDEEETEDDNDINEYSEKSDENDEEEYPKSIQEPTEPKASHRRPILTQHQPKSQSKPPSQDPNQQPRDMKSSYSATSSVSKSSSLHDLAMQFKPLPTNNVLILNELIEQLYDERKQKAQDGDFEGSVTIMRAIDHTKEYLKIAEKKAFQRKQKYEVKKENNKVQSRIAKFDQETSNLEKALKKNIAKSREKLINDLRLEGQKQEKYWQSESHMRLYNRPSHQLRALRHQANQMIACGRFREAEEVMKTANKLQEQEQKQGAYQMQKDYENATKLFDQKVKEELHTFDTDAINQIENLRARRATMRTVFQNQEKKVEQRSELVKDADRCWNANMRTIVKEKMSRRGQYPDQMPRTTRSLGKSFREKQDKIVLSLPKLNTKKVMESPIPAPDYL